MRPWLAGHAASLGLSAARIDDLVLAMDELAANSIRHGGGRGVARIWAAGDAIVGEVADAGSIADPLAGRKRPATDQECGFGLWLVNQLCDLVQIRTFAAGSVVRMHMRLSDAAQPSASER